MAAIAERESNYYDSAYLADYYYSLWTDHPALEDMNVYWEFFKSQVMSQQQANAGFVLLDVGTGTGRVIHSLVKKAMDDADISLDTINFLGVDKSPFMLEYARNVKQPLPGVNTSWSVGSAVALEEIDLLADYLAQVQILIFAFSGINHLHQTGEVDQFFLSARQIVRQGGLALISVCTPLLDVKSKHVENPYGKIKEVRSKQLEAILYREWETGQEFDGDLFINRLKTEVVKMYPDGSEQVLERNNHNVSLMLLNRKSLHKSIIEARFQVLEERRTGDEVIFILKAVS